ISSVTSSSVINANSFISGQQAFSNRRASTISQRNIRFGQSLLNAMALSEGLHSISEISSSRILGNVNTVSAEDDSVSNKPRGNCLTFIRRISNLETIFLK